MKPFGKIFMDRGKKGQTTILIIAGILIVIIAGVLLVNRDRPILRNISNVQVDPIRNFLTECSESVLDQSLMLLKRNAGHYTRFGDDNIYGLSYLNTNTYNPNDVLKRQINDDIKFELETNCDLSVFGQQYDLQIGDIFVDTDINLHNLNVIVDYPITLNRGGSSINLGKIEIVKEDDFGIMNAVAGKIVNEGDEFDLSTWKENSIFKEEEIEVTRNNVPEGTVYIITTPFEEERYAFILEQ